MIEEFANVQSVVVNFSALKVSRFYNRRSSEDKRTKPLSIPANRERYDSDINRTLVKRYLVFNVLKTKTIFKHRS